MTDMKTKIILFATPEFAIPTLKALYADDKYEIILVVTQPDKPQGRKQILTPSPIKILAQEYNLNVFQPINLKKEESIQYLKKFFPDLIIVVAYGKIISQEILDIPIHKSINIHPSLLPLYRGPSPIQTAILNGDKKTGVTIMIIDQLMDHGPILAQEEIILNPNDNAQDLHDQLAKKGANLLLKTIPKYLKKEIFPQEQNHRQATLSKILTREDGLINWQKKATEIFNQIRAFTPWPGAYTFLQDKRIKIIKANLTSKITKKNESGKITIIDQDIFVACADYYLQIKQLQLDGKNETSAKEFILGHKKIEGQILK